MDMICRAADETPVVYIVASPYGGIALIAKSDAPPRVLWIDALSEKTVVDRLFGRGSTDGSYVQIYAALRANPAIPHWMGPGKQSLRESCSG